MKHILTTLVIAAGLAGPLLTVPGTASAEVGLSISVGFGPPALPYYPQPICPGIGFIWTPGYWAYSDDGYFWVPGTWVLAPAVGLLWTPGWWGWYGGRYWWHSGYWGSRVGFYGGIDYGYGYAGIGYHGGYWRGGAFFYNRAVSNVNVTIIHNTYNQAVSNTTRVERTSYNGGAGGIALRPSDAQQRYAREQHVSLTEAQMQQERTARNDPAQHFTVNHGRPAIAATVRSGAFDAAGAIRLERKRDAAGAHTTPGAPSFGRTVRIEHEPVEPRLPARPVVRQPMPVEHEYRAEPRMETPRIEMPRAPQATQVRAETPNFREPTRVMLAPRPHSGKVHLEVEPRHKEKGRPPR